MLCTRELKERKATSLKGSRREKGGLRTAAGKIKVAGINWPNDSKQILFKLGNRRRTSYFVIQKIPFRQGILEIRVCVPNCSSSRLFATMIKDQVLLLSSYLNIKMVIMLPKFLSQYQNGFFVTRILNRLSFSQNLYPSIRMVILLPKFLSQYRNGYLLPILNRLSFSQNVYPSIKVVSLVQKCLSQYQNGNFATRMFIQILKQYNLARMFIPVSEWLS